MKGIIKISLGFVFLVYLIVSINVNFGKNKWQDVLESDAWGYYAYLPAVFIYHDLNFTFYEKVMQGGYFEPRLAYEYRVGHGEKRANKYFCGTALVMAPFFTGAHIISKLMHLPQDGYNRVYILSVNIAAVCYTVLGLFFLGSLLQYYSSNVKHIALVLILLAFGTQLFYYSFGEPGMSHVYSFCFVNLFLWQTKSWIESKRIQSIWWAALALGIVFLIRPVNLLIVLCIPFLAGEGKHLKAALDDLLFNVKGLLLAGLIFLTVASIQSMIYKVQTGNFWIDSYPGENFDFTNPHVLNALFSFRKGLFVYTPIVLVSQAALLYLWKENKFMSVSYALFFLALTYILSSWWIWFYGGGFSLRPFIEYFGIFAVLLLILLDRSRFKIPLMAIMIALVVLCQIQTYQYRYFVIHWSEMNQQKYFESLQHIFKG